MCIYKNMKKRLVSLDDESDNWIKSQGYDFNFSKFVRDSIKKKIGDSKK